MDVPKPRRASMRCCRVLIALTRIRSPGRSSWIARTFANFAQMRRSTMSWLRSMRRARWTACRDAPVRLRFRARGLHLRAVRLVPVDHCPAARRAPPPVCSADCLSRSPSSTSRKHLRRKFISRSWAKSEECDLVTSQFEFLLPTPKRPQEVSSFRDDCGLDGSHFTAAQIGVVYRSCSSGASKSNASASYTFLLLFSQR
jgi:hypothetical protein